MADLTLRSVKGSALSFTEMDSNFLALDSDISGLFASKSTSDLSEGTNLYYTDARVSTLIDSAYINTRVDEVVTLDSAQISSIISADVDKAFVDALNVDADTVDGFHGIGIYDSAGTLLNG